MEDFRNPNQNGWTKIHQLAITGHLYKLRKMLCSSDLELIDKKGRSVLHESAQGGYLYQISNLIQKKMLSLQDHAGITRTYLQIDRLPLIILCLFSSTRVCRTSRIVSIIKHSMVT